MPLVVGVTFRKVGKVYYFDPGELELREGDFVIAETARGVEFGEVVLEPREVTEEELVAPLKKVVRVASGDDLEREASNRERERHAFEVCERKIAEHGLPMKLLDAESAFDGSQVTFSFSADGRIDFRDLVKDVAGALRTKVQLHQIGVRDEAKLIGGYGTCGRSLCCATFEPVSMKMAKDQSLFLNPAKFSGACGKLMCCLRYEHEFYKEAHRKLPAVGAIIEWERGRAKVIDVNVVNGMLTVETEDEVQLHIKACEINMEGLCRKHGVACNMTERNCQPLVAGDYAETDHPDEDENGDTDLEGVSEADAAELQRMSDTNPAPSPRAPESRPAPRPADKGVTFRDAGGQPQTSPKPNNSGGGNGGNGGSGGNSPNAGSDRNGNGGGSRRRGNWNRRNRNSNRPNNGPSSESE